MFYARTSLLSTGGFHQCGPGRISGTPYAGLSSLWLLPFIALGSSIPVFSLLKNQKPIRFVHSNLMYESHWYNNTSHKGLRSVSGQKKKIHFLFRNILQELKRSESLFWVNLVNHWFGTVIGLFIKTQRTNKDTNRTIFCCGEVCCQRWYAIFDGKS